MTQRYSPAQVNLVKRQAIQRMVIGGDGKLTRDARLVMADLRRFCHAGGNDGEMFGARGATGYCPIHLARAAGRREVFDRLVKLMNLDAQTVTTLREEL